MEEDSTDESEREDDDYKASTARYGALIKRTLRNLGPDLESQIADDVMGASSPSHARGLPNGAGQRQQQIGAATSGTMLSSPAAQLPRVRRLYMHGFAPQVTANDIVASLSQFGAIARFRLFQDPVSKLSLRAAAIFFEDATAAARALQAAAESRLYLANVWAPEATLVPDENGEVARRQYEAVVHAPLPALLPLPYEMRQRIERAGNGAAATSGGDPRLGAGGLGSSQGGSHGGGSQHASHERPQLCISGISSQCTPQSVKTAFDQFGRVMGFVGARCSSPHASLSLLLSPWRCFKFHPVCALNLIRSAPARDDWRDAAAGDHRLQRAERRSRRFARGQRL